MHPDPDVLREGGAAGAVKLACGAFAECSASRSRGLTKISRAVIEFPDLARIDTGKRSHTLGGQGGAFDVDRAVEQTEFAQNPAYLRKMAPEFDYRGGIALAETTRDFSFAERRRE